MTASLFSKMFCLMILVLMPNPVNAGAPGATKGISKTCNNDVLFLQGAYYGKVNSDDHWQSVSRTGPYADVAVCFKQPQVRLVFWRGSSYLPYWQSGSGKWYFDELIARHGDGSGLRPDRVNAYSRVSIIESSRARAVVHWRYLSDFSHPETDGWVDEYFTVYPDGVCIRTIRRGALKLDDWLSRANLKIQQLQLKREGIEKLPASRRVVAAISLRDEAAKNYEPVCFDDARRCYLVKCRRAGMPSPLDVRLDADGGKKIYHPVIVVKNFGDAPATVKVDGRDFANYRTGYSHRIDGSDLVVWIGKVSDGSMNVSILPSDSIKVTWSRVAGAQKVTFSNPHSLRTTASLPAASVYKLRLTGSDGVLSGTDDMMMLVSKRQQDAVSAAAYWSFDQGSDERAVESISGKACAIAGHKVLWKRGVSGSALQFDGYSSVVTLVAGRAPLVSDGLSAEAWVAVGAYPWNWAPIVHQSQWRSKGYYLGLDAYGHLGFMVSVAGRWQKVSSKISLPHYRWTHVAGTFDKAGGKMTIYIDGAEAGSRSVGSGDIAMADADLLIGRNNTKIQPTDAVRDNATLPSWYGFDGLIDEVKIYDKPLDTSAVSGAYSRTKPADSWRDRPDMEPRVLPGMPGLGRFGAYYTKLHYYQTWDNLWCVSEHPDVVVKFDELPGSVVFWRGTSYGPGWVTENNKWLSDQGVEEGGGGTMSCCEHMSDKQCRHSHVRIIHSNDARVIVHWRYALVDILYNNPRKNPKTGWGDWVDEYFTIYPDGVGIRNVKYWSSHYGHYSLQDTQFLSQPGTRPEDNIDLDALTVVNPQGQSRTLSWAQKVPKNTLKGANIEMVNLKSKYRPFVIFDEDAKIEPWGQSEKNDYCPWPTWNHWPVSQVLSDGRLATASDRLTHSALGEVDIDSLKDNIMMYGLTNKPPVSLAALSRSWNHAPHLEVVADGFTSKGYDRGQRAYLLKQNSVDAAKLDFRLQASFDSPIINPCFLITNFSPETRVKLSVNGKPIESGPAFRQAFEKTANGVVSLVVWIKMESTSTLNIVITP